MMYRIAFMGTPEFAVPSLQALINDGRFKVELVITQPDKPMGRSKELIPSPVKKAALEAGLKVATPAKLKHNAELLEQLTALGLDAIVVVAYGKILPQEILDIPKHGVVNVHGSILPKYRGASPIAAAILNGETETGVTIMQMGLAMDTGPTIGLSELIPIESYDTTSSLSNKLSTVGAQALIKYLPDYLDSKITPQPQDDNKATTVKLINKQDGVINWSEDAVMIERKIRAYYPWPSMFTKFNGKTLKIIRATVLADSGTPQTAYKTADNYPAIFAGQGSLKLEQVQLEGKKPTTGADFLKGYPAVLEGLV